MQGGLTNGTPADKQNFTLLLATLRLKLDEAALADHHYYYLSIDASPSSSYINDVQLGPISTLVDWINLMTYDMHGSWDSFTGLNSPLYADPNDPSQEGDAAGVQAYLAQGVPAEKINLGIPFYGYEYTDVPGTPPNNQLPGLWQPYDQSAGTTSLDYNTIMTTDYGQDGFVRY